MLFPADNKEVEQSLRGIIELPISLCHLPSADAETEAQIEQGHQCQAILPLTPPTPPALWPSPLGHC